MISELATIHLLKYPTTSYFEVAQKFNINLSILELWSNIGLNKQQMSAVVNREASRNVSRKASQMVDKASLAQRRASATIDSGDDFSHQSTQAKDNYDNFDQTIMDLELEASQIEDRRPFKSSSPASEPLRGDDGGVLLSMLYSLNL